MRSTAFLSAFVSYLGIDPMVQRITQGFSLLQFIYQYPSPSKSFFLSFRFSLTRHFLLRFFFTLSLSVPFIQAPHSSAPSLLSLEYLAPSLPLSRSGVPRSIRLWASHPLFSLSSAFPRRVAYIYIRFLGASSSELSLHTSPAPRPRGEPVGVVSSVIYGV